MKELERTLKALANARRLAIVKMLARRKTASVGDIAEHIKLSFKSTSRHLGILSSAGILEREQTGLVVMHRLAGQKHSVVSEVLRLL